MFSDFYKKKKTDQIWWLNETGIVGYPSFSFDKKKIYNVGFDYPYNLTAEEKEIFDKENPNWKRHFANRQ